jgi:RNA polymerase sigma-70 factor (sigma-E family)
MRASREPEYTQYVQARLDWLRRTAYLLCKDPHGADDLVQTAITRLYTHWGKARHASDLDAYTRTILIRVFLTERGSAHSRRVALTRSGTVDDHPGRNHDQDAAMDIQQALQGLPPRQRATVVLRFYCDLSVKETAAALGVSPGTVKSQTAKALQSLRSTLIPAWNEAV